MIKTVFLDLDDTIFDFHRAEATALTDTLTSLGAPPTEYMLKRYSEINDDHWKRLERGELVREQVLIGRFRCFFEEMGIERDPAEARRLYEERLGHSFYYVDGAIELLSALKGRYGLYLASNGTASVQRSRIALSGIAKYFDGIFISEEVGHNKPALEFFNACFNAIPDFSKENAIIIGDSMSSDISGGLNAGIKTCLFDPKDKKIVGRVKPHYVVKTLAEIPALLETI